MPKKGAGVEDLGVTADGMFVAVGAGGGTAEQRPSRAARREAEKEEREREKREKRRRASAVRTSMRDQDSADDCSSSCSDRLCSQYAHWLRLPREHIGWLAIYDGCIDVGYVQLTTSSKHQRENPKKVKSVGSCLRSGRVRKPSSSKRWMKVSSADVTKLSARLRWNATSDRAGTSEEERGQRSKKKSKASKSDAPAPPKPKASGLDDEPTDAPPEEMWCVKLGLAALLPNRQRRQVLQASHHCARRTMRTKIRSISWQR